LLRTGSLFTLENDSLLTVIFNSSKGAAGGSQHRAAPELGQHNEEVLLELGYTRDDIVRLKEKEII
jgi:crotonobetainyl-CoA:carnitine CoA-transferase CaiB-like acyl-CoA transferase